MYFKTRRECAVNPAPCAIKPQETN